MLGSSSARELTSGSDDSRRARQLMIDYSMRHYSTGHDHLSMSDDRKMAEAVHVAKLRNNFV